MWYSIRSSNPIIRIFWALATACKALASFMFKRLLFKLISSPAGILGFPRKIDATSPSIGLFAKFSLVKVSGRRLASASIAKRFSIARIVKLLQLKSNSIKC